MIILSDRGALCDALRESLRLEREKRPALEAQDAVKHIFQALLGVGHLLGQREAVAARIAAEERVKASEGGLQAAGEAACLNGQPEAIVQDEERDPNFAAPENLHFLSMDARELPEVFAEGEVDGIYLNFSDPWPKARHAKRRLTSRDFLGIYERVLAPGGVVEFKTDNRGLFDFSLEELKEAPHWELRQVTYDLHRDPEMSKGNIMTEYERKFSALGNKICKLVAVYLGR